MNYFIVVFLSAILVILIFSRITGHLTYSAFNVSVAERKEAKILLNYRHLIDISEKQNISAEFVNLGSVTIEEEMFIRIYYYNQSLRPIGEYLDSLRILKPGERVSFRIVFVPDNVGTYYIQARGRYNGRTTETWGRFDVVIYPLYSYEVQPPKQVEKKEPFIVYLSPPKLEIFLNETHRAYVGGEILIPLLVRNSGEREVFDLRFYISYPSGLEVSFFPPYVKLLEPNQTVAVLLKVFVPSSFLEGLYQLNLEAVSNETRVSRIINLNVTKMIPDLSEEYKEKILSLEILLSEIKKRIISLELRGYDVRLLSEKIALAEENLKNALSFIESLDWENSSKLIFSTTQIISEILLEIESMMLLTPKAYPRHFFVGLIVLVLTSFLVLLVLIYWKKRRERRPKLLRGIESETME